MQPMKKFKKYESQIQNEIIKFLKERDWDVSATHGTSLMVGFPDLYACHSKFGVRWIEVKEPNEGRLTQSQRERFMKWASCNVGIWIMTAATEFDYRCLFTPPNWHQWL